MTNPEGTVGGQTYAEILAHVETSPYTDVWLGAYDSDWNAEDEQAVKEGITRLLALWRIDRFQPETMRLFVDDTPFDIDPDEELQTVRPADVLFDLAIGAALNHTDPETAGYVQVGLEITLDGLRIRLTAEGSSWVDRYFLEDDGVTVVWANDLEPEEVNARDDDDSVESDSDPGFKLRFEARFEKS